MNHLKYGTQIQETKTRGQEQAKASNEEPNKQKPKNIHQNKNKPKQKSSMKHLFLQNKSTEKKSKSPWK